MDLNNLYNRIIWVYLLVQKTINSLRYVWKVRKINKIPYYKIEEYHWRGVGESDDNSNKNLYITKIFSTIVKLK